MSGQTKEAPVDSETFKEMVRIERKLESGMPLTAQEQAFALTHHIKGPKLCGHNGCTNQLGPRVDGERKKLADKEVCEDCYFDSLGEVLEQFPPSAGIRRPHGYRCIRDIDD